MKAALLFLFLTLAGTGFTQGSGSSNATGLLYGNKMYPNGTYAHLRGVNVIAKILPSQAHWLEPMHEFLESTKYIKRHYSILPLESFHMTVHPLFTEYEIPNRFKYGYSEWDDILQPLTGNMLGFIMEYLERYPLVLHPRYSELHPSTGILTVGLSLPQEEIEAVANLWSALRRRFPSKASSVGTIGDVFDLDPASGSYGFHFTIGYFYNHANFTNDVAGLMKELEELDSLLISTFVNRVTLDTARLHWFNSMTEFKEVTWGDDENKDSLKLFDRVISTKVATEATGNMYLHLCYVPIVLFAIGVIYILAVKRSKRYSQKDESHSF